MFAARKTDNVSSAANYIEECFSTYLYTGNGTTQTITNGIDLAGKGGLVWMKDRVGASKWHQWFDTARGGQYSLASNAADISYDLGGYPTRGVQFNSNGFSFIDTFNVGINGNAGVSWTFRKQAKFFDVVTYTGNGSNRTIAHNLGSVPGCIIIKRTDTAADWQVYHRSLANTEYMVLNSTAAKATGTTRWNSTTPTSTEFSLGTDTTVNANGGTYVAYLFAHNAGGFGAAGTDNVISCGSFVDNVDTNINLGYEPQWILVKSSSTASQWYLLDTMRGWLTNADENDLVANTSAVENSNSIAGFIAPTATGFKVSPFFNATWIYIAIRRGPMRPPTTGTSVFGLTLKTSYGANEIVSTSFAPDMSINKATTLVIDNYLPSRLTGGYMITNTTAAEVAGLWKWDGPAGQSYATISYTGTPIYWSFRRAPGFFDVVCYTGTGSATTFNHNLTVVPELMIVKSRNNATNWAVYCAYLGGANPANRYVLLNSSQSVGGTAVYWNDTAPTSTVFTVGTTAATNTSSYTYVNYLFATVAGVSKVGSYTGSGTTKQIDCGFTAGARFVMIKRTDSTGDWYVWDTARGIVSGNDPYLLLNSTAAEVTGTDYIDPLNAGFEISSTAPAEINANGGTFIFLAIA